MPGKVLTPLPRANKAPGGLICAGHPVAPEKLPPGVVTVTCARCGRPLVVGQPMPAAAVDLATEFVEISPMPPPVPVALDRAETEAELPLPAGAVSGFRDDAGDLDFSIDVSVEERTPVPRTATFLEAGSREVPAFTITTVDLREVDSARRRSAEHTHLAPPVPLDPDREESTVRYPPGMKLPVRRKP